MRWRAEHEKTGYEHRTPVTAEALAVLDEARELSSGLEDTPLLPAPRDASKCAGRSLVRAWWYRAQTLTGLEPKRGRGWHSLRRKFASDLMDQPYVDAPLVGKPDFEARQVACRSGTVVCPAS